MTDVREREPLTATRAPDEVVAPRQSLVTRALSPLRRATGQDVVVRSRGKAELRDTAFEPKPESRFNIVRWSLIGCVLLPALVTAFYLFFIASDQYVAETRFTVTQAAPIVGAEMGGGGSSSKKDEGEGQVAPSPMGAITGTLNIGGQDAEIVASYIHSRAIIEDVSRSLDVRAIFQRPEADFWARLPRDASSEKLLKYWNQMVQVHIEASSGIVILSVAAFRREDALNLTEAILKSSEHLVNDLSRKIRTDMMDTAESEVRRAEGEVRFALANLTTFRNSRQVIDPVKSATSNAKLLVDLMTSKIEAESQIFIAERVQGPKAPGMATLRDKLMAINQHIAQLKDEMAGEKALSTNMAATIAQFETLELKKIFAETMYKFASNGVERARIASERQQIYLQVFDPPSLPQDYTYPLRWADLLLVVFVLLMMWICGATITASVIDHRL